MHIKTKYLAHIRMAEVCHYQIIERIEKNHSHAQVMECTLKSNLTVIVEDPRTRIPRQGVCVCVCVCVSEKKSCSAI